MAKLITFTKAKAKPKKPKQSKSTKATLNKLKQYIHANEPETVKLLVNNIQGAGDTITYKELREAYLAGGFSPTYTGYWQKKYSKIVDTALRPKWELAAAEAAQEAKDKYPYFLYEPSFSAAASWIKDHGAELATNLAKDQVAALNALIGHVSGYTAITPDEAARIMRPCIGLTKPQAIANARYRETVKDAYLKAHPHGKPETAEKKAAEAAARYAARQHRYRAQMIARTELAYGYNAGHHGATKDAQAQGYIGDCKKKWLTAYDDRVCDICSAMDGETVGMDDQFSIGVLLPPAHPHCRCAVAYEEIENTNLQPQAPQSTIQPQTPPPQNQAAPQPTPATAPLQSAPQPTVTPGPAEKPKGGYSMVDIQNDLSLLPANQHGTAVRSDGGMVEGLNVTGRRIKMSNGAEYYEFSGKLREDAWEAAAKNAKKHGYPTKMDFWMRDAATGQYDWSDAGFQMDAFKIMDNNQSIFEVYADYQGKDQYSMGGFFRFRIPVTGNQAADRKAMDSIFDRAGLKALTADPTDADELLLKKSRIAWQRDPQGMAKIEAERLKGTRHATDDWMEKRIDRILAKDKITDARVAKMELQEVFPGYSTYVDAGAQMEYRKAGLTHIWAGVDSADSVVAICQSDGFTATNYRITSGMKKCGASPGADMHTGGADSVFTRIGVAGSKQNYNSSYLGDTYRVIIDPNELNRTDWYAYDYDNYGNARDDLPDRLHPVDFIKKMKSKYKGGNEIMFRHGISTENFVGISCQDDNARAMLLESFKDAGITEYNGIPIEDFVHVSREIGQDSLLGVEGLEHYSAPF